jgi:hypothetical protein
VRRAVEALQHHPGDPRDVEPRRLDAHVERGRRRRAPSSNNSSAGCCRATASGGCAGLYSICRIRACRPGRGEAPAKRSRYVRVAPAASAGLACRCVPASVPRGTRHALRGCLCSGARDRPGAPTRSDAARDLEPDIRRKRLRREQRERQCEETEAADQLPANATHVRPWLELVGQLLALLGRGREDADCGSARRVLLEGRELALRPRAAPPSERARALRLVVVVRRLDVVVERLQLGLHPGSVAQ